jgi:hypothetical protein
LRRLLGEKERKESVGIEALLKKGIYRIIRRIKKGFNLLRKPLRSL